MDCNTDVVFGGKNWSFTLLYSTVGWDEALSKNKNIFLFSNAILRFNFFNLVSNTPDVIQAFFFLNNALQIIDLFDTFEAVWVCISPYY